jgi:hypothetical protein
MMHLLKEGFVNKYLCWFAHEKPYIYYETMLERIVGSTSSSSNIHKIVDDNSNHCWSMVMNAMRMNHDNLGEDSTYQI